MGTIGTIDLTEYLISIKSPSEALAEILRALGSEGKIECEDLPTRPFTRLFTVPDIEVGFMGRDRVPMLMGPISAVGETQDDGSSHLMKGSLTKLGIEQEWLRNRKELSQELKPVIAVTSKREVAKVYELSETPRPS